MIRPAREEDAPTLTRLSFESKGFWRYPKEYFEIWKPELTITAEYIGKNDVSVLERDKTVVGYYSIVELKDAIQFSGVTIDKGYWLEHMFIAPGHIGCGMGTLLFEHTRKRCETRKILKLGILADPHARGFYEKMGCAYHGEVPSTIVGRNTPMLFLDIPWSSNMETHSS